MKRGSGSGGGEIVQVEGGHIIRATGRKDRHSKVFTAKGPRDRRVRLSAPTAIQFYDVQDRLGYDRPSKAVDWLIKKAKNAIDKLDELPPWNPNDNEPNNVTDISQCHEATTAGVAGSSGLGLDHEFDQQMEGNDNTNSGSFTQSIAETMKSFFPMNSGSSLMNFQSYQHGAMMPRTSSIQNEDLGLSLHTLQDHRRRPSSSSTDQQQQQQQALFSGSNIVTFEGNFSRMVGWNNNGNGESRVGFFLNQTNHHQQHHQQHQQQQQPVFFSSQREPLQSNNYSHLIHAAWEERALLPSAHHHHQQSISNSHFSAEFQVPARIHGEDNEHGVAPMKPSSSPPPPHSNSHY